MTLPSKELLSAVLEEEVTEVLKDAKYTKWGEIAYSMNKDGYIITCCKVNIYEFAYKCKVWAYNRGFLLKSDLSVCEIYPIEDGAVMRLLHYVPIIDMDSEGNAGYPDTEPEAIFEATEWVIEEIE